MYGGGHLYDRKLAVCNHHSFSSAKGLAVALDAGISVVPDISLPNDEAYGVREWQEAGVIQIALGSWRASITTNDIASSPKRGGHPMGGALSMLWHKQSGPVAVASMNDYVRYEGSNMQKASNDSDQFSLTPRIEINSEGLRYANVYDSKAKLTWIKKGDSIEIKVNGDLRDVKGNVLPGGLSAFEIQYSFTNDSFKMSVQSKAAGARLVFPVVSTASERVNYTGDGKLAIQKKSSIIRLTGNISSGWNNMTDKRVFNFVPGFEAFVVTNTLDDNGKGFITMIIDK